MADVFDEVEDILSGASNDIAQVEKTDKAEQDVGAIHPFKVTSEVLKMIVPGLDVNDRGLILPERITFEQAQSLADFFESNMASTPLLWGDLLNQAEGRWRAEWSQLVSDRLGRSEGTLRNWRYICSQIPRDMRPDPTLVRVSKLYHIAGLKSMALKSVIIKMAEVERLDTSEVKGICDLFKLWPEDGREETEDYYAKQIGGTAFNDAVLLVTGDLEIAGYIEQPPEPLTLDQLCDEGVEAQIARLIELAESDGHGTPQNRFALLASMVRLAKNIALSDDAQEVRYSYQMLEKIAGHLAEIRLVQIEMGDPTGDVGCICTVDDYDQLVQMSNCPIHGGG